MEQSWTQQQSANDFTPGGGRRLQPQVYQCQQGKQCHVRATDNELLLNEEENEMMDERMMAVRMRLIKGRRRSLWVAGDFDYGKSMAEVSEQVN